MFQANDTHQKGLQAKAKENKTKLVNKVERKRDLSKVLTEIGLKETF